LKALPIEAAQQAPSEILELPALAEANGITNYDAAYLALALRFNLPLATSDSDLLKAGASIGVRIL
jgi:predicted nucleic acid-binding protein